MSVEMPHRWDEYWYKDLGEDSVSLREHKALLFMAETLLVGFKGKKILEVGAGRGIDSVRMAQKGADAYTVDYSKGSIQVTRFIKEQAEVEVSQLQAAGENLPFLNDCFDLVFSQGLMEHPGDREKLLCEKVRVTKPGGYVLVDVPNLVSIQTPIREVQLLIGRWPYGKEYPFSSEALKKFITDAGLIPIKLYGWGLVPSIHLGVGNKLRKTRLYRRDLTTPTEPNFFTRQIEANIGHLFLNNVGIIAQKLA